MIITDQTESFIALIIGLSIFLAAIFKMLYKDFEIQKERKYIEEETTFLEYLRKGSLFFS
ncbi:MAG: hypothetical protein MK033_07760 [Candidatus Caenarcaniphilales bacterium]|nr:hypothetical protein [Candidatus Caenarcaniphilales bacterium]